MFDVRIQHLETRQVFFSMGSDRFSDDFPGVPVSHRGYNQGYMGGIHRGST